MRPSLHRLRALAPALAAVVAAAWLWRAALWPLDGRHGGDWGYFEHMWEVGRVGILRDGALPHWDPFHCGGLSVWSNPQSQLLHPLFFLALPLGALAALKVFLVAHAALGLAGMFRLARARRASVPAAALAALTWGASGFFAWHGSTGHSTFAAFYLAPWALLAWRAAAQDRRGVVGVALVFAAALLAGGTYSVPYLALLLLVDALPRLRAQGVALLRPAALGASLALCLGAARVAPIVAALRTRPRVMTERDEVSLAMLRDALLARDHRYDLPGHLYGWDEYSAYVGVGALALALYGVVVSLRARRWLLPLGAAAFALLTLGDVAPEFPWPLLRRLPVFNGLRVPSRFVVLVTFYLALLAARGLDALAAALRARATHALTRGLARATPWLFVAVVGADLAQNFSEVNDAWTDPTPPPRAAARFYLRDAERYFDEIAALPARNAGSVGCYEPMPVTPAKSLWFGDVMQARVAQGDGVVRAAGRAANAVWAEVDLPRGGRVVFNQNHDPAWVTDRGVVRADEERLAVTLPPGRQRVTLRYVPPSLAPGLCVSALGALWAAWLWRRRAVASRGS